MTKLASEPNNENKRPKIANSDLKVSNQVLLELVDSINYPVEFQSYIPIKPTFKSNSNNLIKKPTRYAIQRHIDFIQRKKRRKQLSLLKRVLIQEEFENNFVQLNSADLSDSDNEENDSLDKMFYQRKFGQQRYKVMRVYSRIG